MPHKTANLDGTPHSTDPAVKCCPPAKCPKCFNRLHRQGTYFGMIDACESCNPEEWTPGLQKPV
jgi:hypothetical protein